MVQAWFLSTDGDEDWKLPRQFDPPRPVTLKQLEKLGVLYFAIDVDDAGKYMKEGGKLDKLKKRRDYTYEDTITVSPGKLPDYEEMIKKFFTEHIHADEEIRFILDGCGYLDVRDLNDEWIRIKLVKGDFIILPAGIYHRFTTDTDDFITANRLFAGEPVWTAHYRPADDMPARKEYLQKYAA